MVGQRKPSFGLDNGRDAQTMNIQCCLKSSEGELKLMACGSGSVGGGGGDSGGSISGRGEEIIEASTSTSSSNLDQFLHHTSPKVQLQYPPKTCLWDNSVKRWRPSKAESLIPFFTLGDLWDAFEEWSAYGAGVPLVLNGKEAVVQYYVPYLSALQLYTRKGVRRCLNARKLGADAINEGSDYRDSNSETSSDNDSESSIEGISPIRTSFWKKCQSGFCRARAAGLNRYEHQLSSVDEASSDDEEDGWDLQSVDHLLLSYLEDAAPYSRAPLVDKIAELEKKVPELRTLHSYELLPTSWFSIAWYPIYRIPTGPTLKDLGTCFLTFHSLSTPLQDVPDSVHGSARIDLVEGSIQREERSNKLVLRSFGLASYKLRGAFWTSAGNTEKQMASSLESHADSWLKGLHVRHPDYEFFAARSPNRR